MVSSTPMAASSTESPTGRKNFKFHNLLNSSETDLYSAAIEGSLFSVYFSATLSMDINIVLSQIRFL